MNYVMVADEVGLEGELRRMFISFMRYCWPVEEERTLCLTGTAWTWATRFKSESARNYCAKSNKASAWWALYDKKGA